jgi:lysophospholipase
MLDHLVPPPDGLTLPANAEVAVIEAADGIKLRAVFLHPEAPALGTVFLLQGRTEFIEKYAEVFERLLTRQFAIASVDWRGQGGSVRQLANPRKGHVEDFEDYLLDLDALLAEARRRNMPEPYGLLAHSTGGAIAPLALARGRDDFKRAVITSPLVGIAGLRNKTGARVLARTLSSIGLSGLYIPKGGPKSIFEKGFLGNPLTSDAKRFETCAAWIRQASEIGIGDPTIGWVDAAFDAMASFEDADFGRENRTPILMVIAGNDTVVDAEASAALAHRMRSASGITLRGARHEILMETDAIQGEFWPAFDAFMRLGEPEAAPAQEVTVTSDAPVST